MWTRARRSRQQREGFYQTESEYNSNTAAGIGRGWNFILNPLDVNHNRQRGTYFDFYNQQDVGLINSNLRVKSKLHDYFDPFIIGLFNANYYKNNQIK